MPLYFPPPEKSTDDILKAFQEAYSAYDPTSESDVLDKEVKEVH
jgi:predicted small lipoprotein YifL